MTGKNDLQIFWNSVILGPVELDTITQINNGELFAVLQSSVFKKIFSSFDNEQEDIVKTWSDVIDRYAVGCVTEEMKEELLSVGVALLLLFVQQNWTGPEIKIEELQIINYINKTKLGTNKCSIFEELTVDGENIISVVQNPELLLISRLILLHCHKRFSLKITPFWLLRCLFIHQQVLEETSSELFNEINKLMNEVRDILNGQQNINLLEQHLEFARIHLYYGYVQKSKVDIEIALQSSGIQTSLTGALGKRTKFQQEDLAQLTLKVDMNEKTSPVGDLESETNLPEDVKLEDEVRLNKIKFKSQLDGEHPDLTGLQQAVILGVFCQTKKSQAKDRLADEELQPLISCILDKPKTWSVKLSTLLFRSRLESSHKRGVERAMMQIQALIDNIKSDKPELKERLRYFFISYQPPIWEIESSLAKIMVSMGAIKSALDIYLRLEDWENVIHCYNALELRHKAQEIIEQELKKNPTPKLWCFLGDATGDVSHYEMAWKLSNEKSARAQRHWAMHYYQRREYDKSIKHFQLSLERNSLQSELWYRLGYAALHEEEWEVSASAYRRYCVLDPECFEAWNNLARCYCELRQKQRAWRALQEALKVDYSNWRVWDNYILVSSDLREFDEVIRSYHQILNLKEKHLDIPILRSLVHGFKEIEGEITRKEESDEKQAETADLNKFREKLLTLFGRLTSQIVSNSELWYLYSEVVSSDSAENRLKKQQLLSKAYNSAVNKKSWVKTEDSCNEVIHIASKMIDASISTGQENVIASCQLSVRGCLAAIKKEHPHTRICDCLEEELVRLGEAIYKLSK